MARINPAWMAYARDFLQVRYESLTALWASAMATGVQARLMGPRRAWLPETGGYESAWACSLGHDADGQPATGIVVMRGWVEHRRGHGEVTALLRHVVRTLGDSTVPQFLLLGVGRQGAR